MSRHLNTCADVEEWVMADAEVAGMDACTARAVDPDRVAAVRSRLAEPDEAARLAEVFKLLGDPTRTRLLTALLEAGELCVCDLAEVIGVPESSVSHALRLLRTAGIVRNRRDGRMVYYSLADAHVRLLLDLSLEHLRHADADSDARAGSDDGGR
jgi:ArsR family transcriptional regulator, lead/cadmium/zinc/bismuth-responsive transcriptional repressor